MKVEVIVLIACLAEALSDFRSHPSTRATSSGQEATLLIDHQLSARRTHIDVTLVQCRSQAKGFPSESDAEDSCYLQPVTSHPWLYRPGSAVHGLDVPSYNSRLGGFTYTSIGKDMRNAGIIGVIGSPLVGSSRLGSSYIPVMNGCPCQRGVVKRDQPFRISCH